MTALNLDDHGGLGALDARLRANGFAPDPSRWQNVHDLLACLAASGALPKTVDDYQVLLAPLLTASAAQQEDFRRLFAAWLAPNAPLDDTALAAEVQPKLRARARAASIENARKNWLATVISGVLALTVAAAAFYFGGGWEWFNQDMTTTVESGPVSLSSNAEPKTTNNNTGAADPAEALAIPIRPVPPRSPLAPVAPPPVVAITFDAIRWLFISLPLLIMGAWVACRVRRRRTVAEGDRASATDPAADITLKGGNRRPFWGGEVPRALHTLRRGAALTVRRLDVDRTVDRTVREAGLFHPVPLTRRWRPEYVVLADTAPGHEHTTGLADALTERLLADGLLVHRYNYRGRPDHCWEARPGSLQYRRGMRHTHASSPTDLAERHRSARLMVIGEAASVFHPLTAEPLPVLASFTHWTARAWLTPDAAPWGYHQTFLAAAGFAVAPLSGHGVASISEWFADPGAAVAAGDDAAPWFEPAATEYFPDMLANADPWLRDEPDADTGSAEQFKRLTAALSRYAGRGAVRLLAAAAAYPRFHAGLLLALDERLHPRDAAPEREARLLRISRLPWSRAGYMPEWLRRHFWEHLDQDTQQAVRDAYAWIFAQQAGSARSTRGISLPFRVPGRRGFLGVLRDEVQFARPGSAFDDALFATVVMGGRTRVLDFLLPEALAAQLSARLRLGPELMATGLAAAATVGLWAVWSFWAGPALASTEVSVQKMLNSTFHVGIEFNPSTEMLANRLQAALEASGFVVTSNGSGEDSIAVPATKGDQQSKTSNVDAEPSGSAADTSGKAAPGYNSINFTGRWTRLGVAQVRDYLVLLLWAKDADSAFIRVNEDPALVTDADIRVKLAQPPRGGPDVVFTDAFLEAPGEFRDALGDGGFGPVMVAVPAGEFVMGSPDREEGRDPDEGPQHSVRVNSFALAKYEVTFADYDRFTDAASRERIDDAGWGRGTRPVIYVSWNDAQAYAKWLSQQTGESYRLPTEAEWEYAARAGTTTRFWWGDSIQRTGEVMANCRDCGSEWDGARSAPVGSFAANTFGLHDVSGNVLEFVEDCLHDSYQGAPGEAAAWLGDPCTGRVVRGGSWSNGPGGVRSAARFRGDDVDRLSGLGFRVARTRP